MLFLLSKTRKKMNIVVNLTIHRAHGVPKMDLVGHADPYIAVHYPPPPTGPKVQRAQKAYFTTSTQKSTADPVWNQTAHFFLSNSASMYALLELLDEDFVKDELIGSVLIDLREEAKHAVIRVPGTKECCIEYSIEREGGAVQKRVPPAASHVRPQQRDRILEFFEKHCPDRIPQIDGLLAMGSNFNERQYCMALYDELGVPVNERRFAPDFEARLTKFYQKHDPAKDLSKMFDLVWTRFSEDEFWSKVFQKFGVPEECQSCYLQPLAEAVVELDDCEKDYHKITGSTSASGAAACTQHVPIHHSKDAVARTRLTEFFEQHCPDRIPQIDGLLAMGSDFNERQYCMALYDELGVPVNQRRFAPDFEARLTNFYRAYHPEKLEGGSQRQLDIIWSMTSFSSESEIWGALFSKYRVPLEEKPRYCETAAL